MPGTRHLKRFRCEYSGNIDTNDSLHSKTQTAAAQKARCFRAWNANRAKKHRTRRWFRGRQQIWVLMTLLWNTETCLAIQGRFRSSKKCRCRRVYNCGGKSLMGNDWNRLGKVPDLPTLVFPIGILCLLLGVAGLDTGGRCVGVLHVIGVLKLPEKPERVSHAALVDFPL